LATEQSSGWRRAACRVSRKAKAHRSIRDEVEADDRAVSNLPLHPPIHIDSSETRERAHAHVLVLLGLGRHEEVLAYTAALTADPRLAWTADELRAVTLIDVGGRESHVVQLRQGLELMRTTFPDPMPPTAYNIANGEAGLWEIAFRPHNYVEALVTARDHQARARAAYGQVGYDPDAEPELRIQALVNLGNSYDNLGRDVEALRAWRKALEIDPDFAMAHGNIGVALEAVARFARDHAPMLLAQAAAALDRALAAEDQVREIGGPIALEHFRRTRDGIGPIPSNGPATAQPPWNDPHLAWCREHELFLHVSPDCQREADEHLDPLFFAGLHLGFDEPAQQRLSELCDAFNTLKRDYVSARYLTWLVTQPHARERDAMDGVTRRVVWADTLGMARWGVRTGVLIQAFAATTNLLDKVAGYVHRYFETDRTTKGVYFKGFWRRSRKPGEWEPQFEAALTPPTFNRGLIALADLACDLDEDTPLAALLQRRHTATHRFLVAHDQLLEPHVGDWLDREEWPDLVDGTQEILQIARAALIYLARTIDIAEAITERDRAGQRGGPLPQLPVRCVDPDLNEIE
jgi:tetratricopeptide (TPR) repeat protein